MDKKTTVDDIIGIVHTDEITNSVEEVKKLRGRTNERFMIDDTGTLIDMETRNTYDYVSDVVDLLNNFNNEIKIAQSVIQMKRDQISSLARSNREGVKKVQSLAKENEELKKELSEYKDFVLSDDKILCYTCLFCTHKGIYEVDCDVKGHVDVHGSCFCYTKKELQE